MAAPDGTNMASAIQELLASKKFLVGITSSIAAIIVRVSVKWNIGVDEEMANQIALIIVTLAGLYLGSQGAADFGKHAAETTASGAEPKPVEDTTKPAT